MKPLTLFENFIGFMTDFILFNKLVEKDTINLYQKQFNYGLYKLSMILKVGLLVKLHLID